jgi:outer membrane protein assembly factor BamB
VRKCGIVLFILILAQLFVPLVSFDTQADDWPTFQHDSKRLGYSDSEIPDDIHLNWSMEFENNLQSPIIADNKIFFICNETIYTIDILTQQIIWHLNDTTSIGGVIGNRIFVGGYKISALNIDSGDIIWESNYGWKADAIDQSSVFSTNYSLSNGDKVFHLYSLNYIDGALNWETNITLPWSGGHYIAISDEMIFISIPTSNNVYGSGAVFALNANNGSQIWRMDFPSWVSCMPTINNGLVYITSYENKLFALDEYGNGDGSTDVLWTFDIEDYTRSSVAIAYDMIFVGSTKGYLWALDEDPSDGIDEGYDDPDGSEYDIIWQISIGSIEDSSPVVADNKVIIYPDSGFLSILNVSDGNTLWADNLPFPEGSTPAIAYDKLFVCSGKELYVFTLNEKPIAVLNYDKLTGNISTTFNFNANGSYDPDGTVVNYIWEINGNTIKNKDNISHKFNDDGTYDVNLTVIDNDGTRSIVNSKNIHIENLPPIAKLKSNKTEIFIGESITFNAKDSSDPDDINLNYTWDFDDGSKGYGKIVNHIFTFEGEYNVELTLTDDDGDTDNYQLTIEVTKKPSDDETPGSFFSNTSNLLMLGLIILVIVILLVFLVSRFNRNRGIPKNAAEPLFPSIIDISCPECGNIFEIPKFLKNQDLFK